MISNLSTSLFLLSCTCMTCGAPFHRLPLPNILLCEQQSLSPSVSQNSCIFSNDTLFYKFVCYCHRQDQIVLHISPGNHLVMINPQQRLSISRGWEKQLVFYPSWSNLQSNNFWGLWQVIKPVINTNTKEISAPFNDYDCWHRYPNKILHHQEPMKMIYKSLSIRVDRLAFFSAIFNLDFFYLKLD